MTYCIYVQYSQLKKFSLLHIQGVHQILCFFEYFKIYSGLWPLSVSPRCASVCTQWQVKPQHCNRTGRVQKNPNILRKNTILDEHPVPQSEFRKISEIQYFCLVVDGNIFDKNKFIRNDNWLDRWWLRNKLFLGGSIDQDS